MVYSPVRNRKNDWNLPIIQHFLCIKTQFLHNTAKIPPGEVWGRVFYYTIYSAYNAI